MFKIFRKKRGKTMALNQEELEKLKGLSKEDKEQLIKSLSEENLDGPKGAKDDDIEAKDDPKDIKEEPKEVKKVVKQEKKVEEPDPEPKKEPEKDDPKQEPKVEVKGNAWEKAIAELNAKYDKTIEDLKGEVEALKKRSPKGYEPKPTPQKHDLKDETEKTKSYLKNMY